MTPTAGPNEPHARLLRWLLWGIAAVGFAVPLIFYGLIFGTVDTLTPPQAIETLLRDRESAVLVDVRPAAEFRTRHIDGAENWPLAEIITAADSGDVPERLAGKKLLLICDGGVNSTRAARHLDDLGVERAAAVRGGIEEWIGTAGEAEPGPFQLADRPATRMRSGKKSETRRAIRENRTVPTSSSRHKKD